MVEQKGLASVAFERERLEPARLVEVAGPWVAGMKSPPFGGSMETAHAVCRPGEFDLGR